MKFGEETGPVVMPDYGAYRFTRVAGPTPDAPDVYSPLQAGWVSPGTSRTRGFRYGRRSRPRPDAPTRKPRPTASRSAPSLREQSGAAGAGPRIRDPIGRPDVPRAGMRSCLVRHRRKKLELVLGVQSPYEAAESVAFLLGKARAPLQAHAYQRSVRLYGRRIWRTRPHALPALRRIGGDVPPRPAGPARP